MAVEPTKRKITIDGVSRIEDVLPYAHLPDGEALNARQEYLRSLLYQESENTLRHMYSCIYDEPIPSNKFEIVTKMFTTLKRARNEITLLKKRRAEIDALNKTNTIYDFLTAEEGTYCGKQKIVFLKTPSGTYVPFQNVSDFFMYARTQVVKNCKSKKDDGQKFVTYKVKYALGVCTCPADTNEQGELACRFNVEYQPEAVPLIEDTKKTGKTKRTEHNLLGIKKAARSGKSGQMDFLYKMYKNPHEKNGLHAAFTAVQANLTYQFYLPKVQERLLDFASLEPNQLNTHFMNIPYGTITGDTGNRRPRRGKFGATHPNAPPVDQDLMGNGINVQLKTPSNGSSSSSSSDMRILQKIKEDEKRFQNPKESFLSYLIQMLIQIMKLLRNKPFDEKFFRNVQLETVKSFTKHQIKDVYDDVKTNGLKNFQLALTKTERDYCFAVQDWFGSNNTDIPHPMLELIKAYITNVASVESLFVLSQSQEEDGVM
eukprot:g1431.t1